MKRLEHRGGNIKKSNQGELFKITEDNFIPRVQYCLHVKPADVPIFIIIQPPRTVWREYTFAEAHPDTIFLMALSHEVSAKQCVTWASRVREWQQKSEISQATTLLHTHEPATAVLWHLKEALWCKLLLGLWRTSGSFPGHICEP